MQQMSRLTQLRYLNMSMLWGFLGKIAVMFRKVRPNVSNLLGNSSSCISVIELFYALEKNYIEG
jgi:hypothetical protein